MSGPGRGLIRVSLALLGVVATVAMQGTGTAQAVQRKEFSCRTVDADYSKCDADSVINVLPGELLCVAVRNSSQKHIIFRAYNHRTGAWKGRESRRLSSGSGEDCTWRNSYSTTVTIAWQARQDDIVITEPNVDATANTRR